MERYVLTKARRKGKLYWAGKVMGWVQRIDLAQVFTSRKGVLQATARVPGSKIQRVAVKIEEVEL